MVPENSDFSSSQRMPLLVPKQWLETPLIYIHPVLLSVLLLVSIHILGLSISLFSRKQNLPPSPPKLPIIGNLHQIGSTPHRGLWALAKDYGPLMLLHMGSIPIIVVSSADMAREVMKTQDVIFASRPRSCRTFKWLVYDCKDIAFSPYGEYWRNVRKISVLHLLIAKVVHSFQVVRDEELASMVEKISSLSSLAPIDLSEMLTTLTNDIICRVVVGKKYSGDETSKNRFHELIKEVLELLGAFHVGDHVPSLGWLDKLSGLDTRMKNNHRRWDSFLEEVIEEQLLAKNINSQKSNNFVNLLLSLKKENTNDGISLNQISIKAILKDMFVAGTETSSNMMTWAMAELLRHPEVMKKAQEEVRSIVRHNSSVCKEDIDQMNYLKLVIKEALRMYPPLPLLLPRESLQDVKLGIYDIPSKTRLLVNAERIDCHYNKDPKGGISNAWAIGRDPEVWEEPERFWPERFIQYPLDFNGQDFKYLPFGAGRRKCPGIQFSMSIVEHVLANLLHHFNWELPNGIAEKDLDMTEAFGLLLCKKSNLVVVAKPLLPEKFDA